MDVARLLADAAPVWRALAEARGARLAVEPSPAVVAGDPLRLAQACANLVTNAIEHGGGHVRVTSYMAEEGVRIEVADDGPGLPAPLAQLITAARGRRSARGHGLAIAAAIAERHGGRLSAIPSRAWSAPRVRAARGPASRYEDRARFHSGPVSRRRRAALLLGLALVLGALAASDVARREAALREQVGPAVEVLVARAPLATGRRVRPGDLAVRRVPEQFAPAGAAPLPELVMGERLAVPVPAGAPVGEHLLERATDGLGPLMRRGERAAEVVARGSPDLITPGARVDVVVTRERRDSQLALENVEVLSARSVTEEGTGPQVAATLRVTVRQAVYLAAAATFAAEIRLLARPPGDDRRAGAAVVGSDLSVLPSGG